tara:strand:+ start:1332 stop:2240 length:909 start_codon:yes stop_codon:yes gene_type:complete
MSHCINIKDVITDATNIINDSDAILIVAGAGMGIDSGLPDYRGPQGLWNSWHPARELNMSYESLSTHEQFINNPELAWGFQTYLTRLYNELEPHDGYKLLLNLCQKKFIENYFVITSNVDSQFLKSGFNENKLYEVHGTKRLWQCMDKKCNKNHYPWNMSINDLPLIDDKTLRANKPFPKCIHCNSMARPNVSFFNDFIFNEKVCKNQSLKLLEWLKSNKGKKLVIIEFGCGLSKHSIRFKLKNGQYTMLSNEWKLPKCFLSDGNTKLIRVNPDDDEDEGVVKLKLGSMKAMKMISTNLKLR